MILGTALILGALALFLWNQWETSLAGDAALEAMPQLLTEIAQAQSAPETEAEMPNIPLELLTEEDLKMTEMVINGRAYIGYLSIPDLKLDLPIQSEWSYPSLQVSPCRYCGSLKGENLVLLAHNYSTHFGKISSLTEGARLTFTDMDGKIWKYEVAAKDVLDPYAVEEMTAGDYDLTLFTCTYGGASRVTVYCDFVKD